MRTLTFKLRMAALCLLVAVFAACETAPPSTSTPLPTATSAPTQTPAPTAVVTAEATAMAGATDESTVEASASAATTGEASASGSIMAHVKVTSATVRKTPSIRGETVGTVNQDDEVTVIAKSPDNGYALIENADGSIQGWVALLSLQLEDLLAEIPVATAAP